MNLNTKTVEALATTLKVDAAKLSAELVSNEADTSKQQTKVSELINGIEVLSPTDKTTLLENHGRSKYNEGALAGKEILLKNLAKEYGLKDVTITEAPKLINKIVEIEKEKSGISTDEKIKTLSSEKEALQQTVLAKEAEITKWKGEIENVKTSTVIQSQVNSAIAELNIDAHANQISGQKEILSMAFLSKHEIKVEDGRSVVYKDGRKLVDHLQNPVSVSQAMKEFAPSYVTLKSTPGGRGEQSSTQTQLNGDLSNITDSASLSNYLAGKNIKVDSKEALAIYREVRTKNPSFK